MTLGKRVRTSALALVCLTAFSTSALAAPQALSSKDAQAYAAAFAAVDRGDAIEAKIETSQVKDPSLLGHLSFRLLMQPSGYKASFEDLKAWLTQYADLPGADRIFSLASRRKPAGAETPRAPLMFGAAWTPAPARPMARTVTNPTRAGQAREAFYSGDLKRSLALAPAAGDFWIAGLAAYRLKTYVEAETYFAKVAGNPDEDPWLRAGGAYWASRSAVEAGDPDAAKRHLTVAAGFPQTFYGMIAQRQARLQPSPRTAQRDVAPQGEFVLASYSSAPVQPSAPDLSAFLKADARAHRAAALAQIGRLSEAGLELRAGLTLARTPSERDLWKALVLALNAQAPDPATAASLVETPVDAVDYPIPTLEPKWGFTIDKALVYAIVRQESRFNPLAVSRTGAVGLMQLMPSAAARAAGDDKLKTDTSPLFDPAFNLRVGQDYLTWLMQNDVGYDILRTVAAYNGGPGTLVKTARMVGEDADSLMIIECMPALETRNYVEKVMAAYWTYRRQFGQDSRTLDAIANGDKFIDARLDK